MNPCPLCNSKEVSIINVIDGNSLTILYNKLLENSYHIDITKDVIQFECNHCGINFFDPELAGDEAFYEALQLYDWYYWDDKLEYETVKKFINNGDTLLDVGCGKGAFAKYVKNAGGQFIGLEYSKKAIDIGKKESVNILNKSIQEYSKQFPSSVDIVVSFQVCEHVSDIAGFIEGKLKALKKNGLMIIAVPSFDSFLSRVTNGILNMPPNHISLWPDKVFSFIANEYDLDLVEINHESIQNVHKSWFLSTLVQNSLIDFKLVDLSLKRKILVIFSNFLAKFLLRGFSNEMNVRGHTVIAVFRKK
jgi:2-polyprenyl-3-methyl-5-hydroxy-6-metoxy-1,4-benzoquinol methylase